MLSVAQHELKNVLKILIQRKEKKKKYEATIV